MSGEFLMLIICLSLCAVFGAVWLCVAFLHPRSIVPPMPLPHVSGLRFEKEGAEFFKPIGPDNRIVMMGLNGYDISEKPLDKSLRNHFIGSGWY